MTKVTQITALSPDDLCDALLCIAGGVTAAQQAALAAGTPWDLYRTPEGLAELAGTDPLRQAWVMTLTPGDTLADEGQAKAARRAAAMTRLEAGGWTQDTALEAMLEARTDEGPSWELLRERVSGCARPPVTAGSAA